MGCISEIGWSLVRHWQYLGGTVGNWNWAVYRTCRIIGFDTVQY
jgi:hypothetical protein